MFFGYLRSIKIIKHFLTPQKPALPHAQNSKINLVSPWYFFLKKSFIFFDFFRRLVLKFKNVSLSF